MGEEGGTCVCVVKKLSGGVIHWEVGTQLAPNISTHALKSQCGENGHLTVGGILF